MTVEEYVAAFPADVRKRLNAMRQAVRKAAPAAEEKISYGVPTYKLGGNLVHFGGFKQHIGFYPGPDGISAFKEELSAYKGAKGSVQFPHDEPLPLELVTRIVKFRVKQALKKVKGK